MKTSCQLTALLATLAFPGSLFADEIETRATGKNCIKLTGHKDYSWKADGSFSGEGNIDDQTHCFGSGGGGISFGAPAAPAGQPGNTRLECFFPEDETDASFYNCNLSLVDGFSAAVTCAVNGGGWPNSNNDSQPLGCGYDLMSDCPKSAYDDTCKCCKNHDGAKANSVTAVDPVFQTCKDTDAFPNSAEIHYNMKGAFKFSASDFPIECKVGAGKSTPSSKVRRDERNGHQHARHQKRSSIHPRQLRARNLLEVPT